MKPDPFQDSPLRQALRHMFNGELAASLALLKGYVAMSPRDPLGHSFSAVVPFYQFVGSQLGTGGGGSIQDMILGKGIGIPADLQEVGANLRQARRLSEVDLAADARDQNALLALCLVEGVERDVLVLVHKRWMEGLKHAQGASLQARRLLEVNSEAYDAYYVIGVTEYVLSQVPAIFRPFARIPGIIGKKTRAIEFLEAAAGSGFYLQDFARQMLVTIYLEERRPQDAARLLEGLAKDFAGNRRYPAELEKLKA